MELATSGAASADFVGRLIPEKMHKEMLQQLQNQKNVSEIPDPFADKDKDGRPDWMKENRPPSEEELRNATTAELQAAFRMKIKNQDWK
jgi:hypothetical protein